MDIVEEKLPIGPEEVAEAAAVLQKYKAGKAALDKRLVDNELWFRMGHWKNYQNPMMEGKPQPSSGWLFNSIANKHADAMDNYPAPNVLPRAADDEQTARVLSSILPVVLEQADYEQVYSDTWWRKLKQGTGVKGVFWDPEAHGGLGEIAIRPMNLLMLYWEPGVEDIQTSPNFFSLRMENTRQLETRWPQLKGHSASVLDVPRFLHDGGLDTTEKSVVVDWYYKKPDAEGRVLLHYCKFCNGVVLYASENDPALAGRGFYDHGKYPFVFDPLFMEEDSPAGFGYIDVMKECQTAIDRMNHAMDENVLLASKQRYVLSDTAGVNEEELADLSRDIVHVVGLLAARGNIHMDYGILGSSDLDQASPIAAKLQTNLLLPLIYPVIRDGRFKSRLLQKRLAQRKSEMGGYLQAFMEMLGGARPYVTVQSCKNQFYSDLVSPLPDKINVPGTEIHIFYALKMGEKYRERYERHFANPVIHKQDLQHEELLACYPERWAQLVKDIMEGKR